MNICKCHAMLCLNICTAIILGCVALLLGAVAYMLNDPFGLPTICVGMLFFTYTALEASKEAFSDIPGGPICLSEVKVRENEHKI